MATFIDRFLQRSAAMASNALAGPQLLAFLPALTLGAYWFGGEGALVVAAISVPGALAVVGLFGHRSAVPPQTDSLTGLVLKDSVEGHIDRVFSRAGTFGFTTACLAVKIDDFDQVVERFGADAGEAVLKNTALRLQSVCRANDVVGRLHGASFAVGLSAIRRADLEAMIQLSGRIQDAMAEPVLQDGLTLHVTASVGFALPGRVEEKSGAAMVKAAELALGHAQQNGPGAIRAYEAGMQAGTKQETAAMTEVAHALEAGQIQPWFQPQVSTDTGQVTGFEALARWQHPARGTLLPAEFLPTLERAGLMPRLGEIILYGAVQALRAWDRAGIKVPRVAVNLSKAELDDPKLTERILWELDRFDLAPDRITVDIRESALTAATDSVAAKNLIALSEVGVGIDLDDFGTGHASITTIRRFQVARLKIDRSFVTKLDMDPEQQRVVSAVLTMAERLDIETVAEGVETPGEHARLAELGCTHVQGFGLARPMPFSDTIAWVEKHGRKIANARIETGKAK